MYSGTLEIVLTCKKLWCCFYHTMTETKRQDRHLCFLLNSLAESGWSVEGVTTETETVEGDMSIVQCSSLHLTSFAVLVDVRGVQVRTTPAVSHKARCSTSIFPFHLLNFAHPCR